VVVTIAGMGQGFVTQDHECEDWWYGPHQKDAVERGFPERQEHGVDEGRCGRSRARPHRDALRGRHQGDGPLGLVAENRQIGVGIADAGEREAPEIGPDRAQPCRQDAPRHLPHRAAVEGLQFDDVERHSGSAPASTSIPPPSIRPAQGA